MDEWEHVRLTRIFRGCEYSITIDNQARKGNSVKALYVNGEKQDGVVVAPKGDRLEIKVVMG